MNINFLIAANRNFLRIFCGVTQFILIEFWRPANQFSSINISSKSLRIIQESFISVNWEILYSLNKCWKFFLIKCTWRLQKAWNWKFFYTNTFTVLWSFPYFTKNASIFLNLIFLIRLIEQSMLHFLAFNFSNWSSTEKTVCLVKSCAWTSSLRMWSKLSPRFDYKTENNFRSIPCSHEGLKINQFLEKFHPTTTRITTSWSLNYETGI